VTALLSRVRSESGQALISGLILLAGVLIPLLFLVPLFARVEQGRLAVEQAARDAVRAAVQSPSPTAAEAAAEAAVARARVQTGEPLELTLEGEFARASVLRARVRTDVDLASIPLFGAIGTVEVSGDAAAPVDRYRSLLGAPSP
jgi:Flp pilus assembly protein TadG